MSTGIVLLLLLLGSVGCEVAGQVCFKLGVDRAGAAAGVPAPLRRVLHSPWIALGIGVYAVEFVVWFAALSRAQLSVAFPFTALGYAGVVLASRFILGERVSRRRWVGMATIVVGVALITGPHLD